MKNSIFGGSWYDSIFIGTGAGDNTVPYFDFVEGMLFPRICSPFNRSIFNVGLLSIVRFDLRDLYLLQRHFETC